MTVTLIIKQIINKCTKNARNTNNVCIYLFIIKLKKCLEHFFDIHIFLRLTYQSLFS